MRAYLDLWTGLSGDMMVGALLGAGWPESEMLTVFSQIGIPDARVRLETRSQKGLAGFGIRVEANGEPPERSFADIRRILAASTLSPSVRTRSLALLHRLAVVEGAIHGTDPESVHFHELGAIDSIADVVLTVAGLEWLEIEHLSCGPVPLSRGEVRTAHGVLPVPTPATLSLLEGVPIRWLPMEGEWLTPTGALILAGLVDSVGPPPEMRLQRVGIGAGTRQSPDRANIVRLLLGDEISPTEESIGWVSILETNLDDLDARHEAEVVQRLSELDVLDVFRVTGVMKKGRIGSILTVVCRPEREDEVGTAILRDTTSLGIRIRRQFRRELNRSVTSVSTEFGPVRIKWSRPQGMSRPMAEFEDVRLRAAERGCRPGWSKGPPFGRPNGRIRGRTTRPRKPLNDSLTICSAIPILPLRLTYQTGLVEHRGFDFCGAEGPPSDRLWGATVMSCFTGGV